MAVHDDLVLKSDLRRPKYLFMVSMKDRRLERCKKKMYRYFKNHVSTI